MEKWKEKEGGVSWRKNMRFNKVIKKCKGPWVTYGQVKAGSLNPWDLMDNMNSLFHNFNR